MADPMTPAEQMREAAADWCADEADNCDDAAKWGGHRKYVSDCKAAAYALRNAASKIRAMPVDVNETPLCEHQTGLMLTDVPQRPADPVMDEVGLETLRPLWKAHGGNWHGPRVEHWTIPEANMAAFFNAALALIKGRG